MMKDAYLYNKRYTGYGLLVRRPAGIAIGLLSPRMGMSQATRSGI